MWVRVQASGADISSFCGREFCVPWRKGALDENRTYMKKLKTAVVGVGSLGRHHLRWLSKLDNSELIGLYDIDRERAGEFAAEYGVMAFDSLDALAEQVEAASIVVTTSAHFEVASRLLEKGIHCLIEKPITQKLEESTRLQEIADETGVKVTVGQIERFNPAVKSLDGLDVRPSFIEAHRLAAFDPRGTDVAVVLDLMIHDIDLALMFVQSEVADIQASAVAVISDQVDIANARLTFENGAVANLTASRISLRPMRKLRIFQKSGYYSLDLAAKQADLYRLAEPGEKAEGMRLPLGKSGKDIIYSKKEDSGQDMLGAELESFLDAIINDTPVAVSVADASEALRVALKIERIGLESIATMMGEKPS
ncbi:MAG: gfo/Idh/MocA family oxidoreductase [Candidatus Zixiibacteriota bacterium]|nr:MAG: gfo/Idh/MocA family oxidoreductase [candidate division Zixibacteria bacterium]